MWSAGVNSFVSLEITASSQENKQRHACFLRWLTQDLNTQSCDSAGLICSCWKDGKKSGGKTGYSLKAKEGIMWNVFVEKH